jgi:hypothetical protein
MATSPIYSWPEPDNTDLVKNGALAIRTLGNAIDTTMGTMTPKSIVDAKGDIIAASANDTPARLAVGNNGETLVADSSTSTGLRYQGSRAAGRNFFINGGQDIWQRGTSIAITTGTSAYTSDRWQAQANGANNATTVSRQLTNDTTNLPDIQYCARVQRNSGQTGTTVSYFAQSIETANSIPLAGRIVTVSYYARAGADYSTGGSALGSVLVSGTGTDQSILTTYTGAATVVSQPKTLTTTWQRFTLTGTVSTSATELAFYVSWTPSGTAGANDWFEITGVQLEVGSVPTQFSRAGGTIQGELAACQRYYYRQNSAAASARLGYGQCRSTTEAIIQTVFPVSLRTTPTAVEQTGTAANYSLQDAAGSGVACNAVPTFNDATTWSASTSMTRASGLVAGNATTATVSAANIYLAWSAEL